MYSSIKTEELTSRETIPGYLYHQAKLPSLQSILGNQDVRTVPFSRWKKIMSVLWSALLLILLARYVSGCYALLVSDELPDDLQNLCKDQNIPYAPPKRI
ncbi:transcription elongation factor SPT4 homolog 1-like isoform X2 [Nicotiana sylvestris]|uniref:transcription elongation factor SPT4 homolog 1-like isoform X2 n=1 Tax=Nicotiana sylvestris TaxID=4096 RepID=UPI00388C67FC